jgi:group I intron endonuclease
MDISNAFNPGLYKITCLKNQKFYIGQSCNVLSRLGRHTDSLENDRHDCIELQKDFNKYGKSYFKFEVLKWGSEFNSKVDRQEHENLLLKSILTVNSYNKHSTLETFSARCVKIYNKVYLSLNEAAKQENQSKTNLIRKCRDKKNENYEFLKQQSTIKYRFHSARTCQVKDQVYNSLNEAAKALNVNHSTIKYRIMSKKFPDYFFVNKISRSNDYPEEE